MSLTGFAENIRIAPPRISWKLVAAGSFKTLAAALGAADWLILFKAKARLQSSLQRCSFRQASQGNG